LARTYSNIGNSLRQTGQREEALASYEKALEIHERVARENTNVHVYQNYLGSTLNSMSKMDVDLGRWIEARKKLARAIVHQRAARASEPRNPTYRRDLREHLRRLSGVELQLRHPTDAATAARELATLALGNRDILHDVACLVARCAALSEGPIADSGSRIANEGPEAYADEAMAYLKQAIAAGWSDLGRTATVPDLKPLHGRRDFQEIVFDRIFPAMPFAPRSAASAPTTPSG
jgi:tetratricopeptide (TPR) repeat protein